MSFEKGQKTTEAEIKKAGFKLRQGSMIKIFTRKTGKKIKDEDSGNMVPEVEMIMYSTRSQRIFHQSVGVDIVDTPISVDLLKKGGG
ncbi:MAG: hypothetical protein WC242_04250 [Candidatus Paceibacterota bacterium]|jgi:hypothetical protein